MSTEPRTVEQWLAYGDDLPVELGRVLTPRKHELYPSMDLQFAMAKTEQQEYKGSWECVRCHQWFKVETEDQIDMSGWPDVFLVEGE